MTQFFQRRDPWGNSVAVWIICGMVFCLPIAIWGVRQVRMENEVQDWVGHDNPQAKAYRWAKSKFPGKDAFLFSWEGSHLGDPRIGLFVDKVLGTPGADGIRQGGMPQVSEIHTPFELIGRIQQSTNCTRAEAIRRAQGLLVGSGPLCVQLAETARPHQDEIKRILKEQSLSQLGLALTFSAPSVDSQISVPTGEGEADDSADPIWKAHDLQIQWAGCRPQDSRVAQVSALLKTLSVPDVSGPILQDAFFLPGTPVALAIYLSESGEAERTPTLDKLLNVAEEVGIPEKSIHMGGGAVAGSALNREVTRATWNPAAPWFMLHQRSLLGLSLVIGCAFTYWMLRSLWLTILVLGCAYFSVMVSMALLPILGNLGLWRAATGSNGTLNMVLTVMPPLLMFTTISGGVHLVNYWKHAATLNVETAASTALEAAWTPCFWACATTALGLASLCVSSLQPIRDFGLYSAMGVMISLSVILFGLPALLHMFPARVPEEHELDTSGWRLYGVAINRVKVAIISLSLVVAIGASFGLSRFQTETKVIRYFSERTRVVQDYDWLEQNLAGVVPIEVIVRFDKEARGAMRFLQRAEKIRQIQGEISKLPDISGSLSLATFLPATEYPGERAPLRVRQKYFAKSRVAETRVDNEPVTKSLRVCAGEKETSEFNAAQDELWLITARVSVMSKTHYGTLTKQLDQICQNVLRTVASESAEDFRETDEQKNFHPCASHLVTGMAPLFLATQEELLHSLVNSFLLAFVTIGVVMMLQLRSFVAGLITMIPNVAPIGFVFGAISWAGQAVDIGTIITASIAMGIAVDGTLHMITWFRLGLERGKSRSAAMIDAVAHCGPALWQTSAVIIIGLLALYPSDLVLISRFGWLMAALIFAALIADSLLTPALLAGPLGWILERKLVGIREAVHNEERPTSAVTVDPPEDGEAFRAHFGPYAPRIARID